MLNYTTFDTLADAMAHLEQHHEQDPRGLQPVLLFQSKDDVEVKLALILGASHSYVQRMLDKLPAGTLHLVYATSPDNPLERIALRDWSDQQRLVEPRRHTFSVATHDAARAAAVVNTWFSRRDVFLMPRADHIDVVIGKENAEQYATDAHANGESLTDIQVVRADMHSVRTQDLDVSFKTVCVFELDN